MMTMPGGVRPGGRTATFVLGDVVGSTRLWAEAGESMPDALARLDALVDTAAADHHGRSFEAIMRRAEVLKKLGQYGGLQHGVRARIARELGVHRSTITRDVQAVLFGRDRECPTCHTTLPVSVWKRLREEGMSEHESNPSSPIGDAQVAAREAVAEVLPHILGELGYFENLDDLVARDLGDEVETTSFEMADLVEMVLNDDGDEEDVDQKVEEDDPEPADDADAEDVDEIIKRAMTMAPVETERLVLDLAAIRM